MSPPRNGRLIYANEHGRITGNKSYYPMGTFVEVQCENETMVKGDGFLSCIDSGTWDLPVPECVPIPKTTTMIMTTTVTTTTSTTTIKPSTSKPTTPKSKSISIKTSIASPISPTTTTTHRTVEVKTVATQQFDTIPTAILTKSEVQTQPPNIEQSTITTVPFKVNALPDKHFWGDLKQLYYHGCNTKEMKSSLCALLKDTSNYTDLTLFELPDNNDFKHMDQKLLTHLAHADQILNLKPNYQLTVERLFPFILYGDNESAKKRMPSTMENAYRFVLCLYIDTIIFDRNLNVTFLQEPPPNDDNITQKLKYYIVRVASKAFDEYSQTDFHNNEVVNMPSHQMFIASINTVTQSTLMTNSDIFTDKTLTSPITNAPDTSKMPFQLESDEQNLAVKPAAILESESVDETCQLEALPDTSLNSFISEIKTENEVLFKTPDRLYLIGPVSIRTRAYVECKEGFKTKSNQIQYFECNEQLKWTGTPVECEGMC